MKNTTMKSIILYVHLKRLIHTYLFIMVGTEQDYMPCHRCGSRREHLDVKSLLHHVGFWDLIQVVSLVKGAKSLLHHVGFWDPIQVISLVETS